jgi:antitoxin (DNA-binding transcriptional repressor) of toxin-antitoxin stability system
MPDELGLFGLRRLTNSAARSSSSPLTSALCHFIVSHMKTASIRDLKHDTTTVLGWVAAGESVEIQKRGKPVAILSRPAPTAKASARPDFAARLKSIYGDTVLATTATELLADERGDR